MGAAEGWDECHRKINGGIHQETGILYSRSRDHVCDSHSASWEKSPI